MQQLTLAVCLSPSASPPLLLPPPPPGGVAAAANTGLQCARYRCIGRAALRGSDGQRAAGPERAAACIAAFSVVEPVLALRCLAAWTLRVQALWRCGCSKRAWPATCCAGAACKPPLEVWSLVQPNRAELECQQTISAAAAQLHFISCFPPYCYRHPPLKPFTLLPAPPLKANPTPNNVRRTLLVDRRRGLQPRGFSRLATSARMWCSGGQRASYTRAAFSACGGHEACRRHCSGRDSAEEKTWKGVAGEEASLVAAAGLTGKGCNRMGSV